MFVYKHDWWFGETDTVDLFILLDIHVYYKYQALEVNDRSIQ